MKAIKKLNLALVVGGLAMSLSLTAHAFKAELADPQWTGDLVPSGMQCQKFGGEQPRTPGLVVSEIPEGTNVLIFEYSDRSYEPMDKGGHGQFGFAISHQTGTVWVPQVLGHSFDLPKGFFLIEAHRNPKWDQEGAYMPPCSGGKNNSYYVTVKAAQIKNDKLEIKAESVLELGKY